MDDDPAARSDGLAGAIATLHRGLRWAVLILSLAAGVGLVLNVSVLTRVSTDWPQIYPYTVGGTLLLLAGLWLLDLGGTGRSRVGRGLAITVGVLAAGVDAGVAAGLLPSADHASGAPATWVTALPTLAAVSLAASIALLDVAGHRVARARFWLAAVAMVVPVLGVLSYLYSSADLFGALGVTGTSLPTSILGVLVAAASLSARPEAPPLSTLASRYDAGLVHRVLPLVVAIPLVPPAVAWWVAKGGESPESAAAIAQLVTVAIMIAVVAVAGGGQSRVRQQRSAERADLWAAFSHAPSATALTRPDGHILLANPALTRLTHISADDLLGRPVLDLVAETDRERVAGTVAAVASGGRGFAAEDVRIRRPDGDRVWVELAVAAVRSRGGDTASYLVIQAADVTHRKDTERQLTELAVTDPLTGLTNREGMRRRLSDLVDRLAPGQVIGLVYADVDDLKPVNDVRGHAAGDELLREVARRLTGATRAGDLVARVGGDEFVVADVLRADDPRLDALVARLRGVLDGEVSVAGQTLPLRVSLGAALFDPLQTDLDTALGSADRAMYDDKRQRRSAAG